MAIKFNKRPLNTCCGISLKYGALFTGILSMIAAALTLVYVILTKDKLHTIILEWPQPVIKVILGFNLFMTIVISGVLVIGVLKERKFYLVIWVILGIMLVISWVISVVYWGVVYLINHQHFEAIVWLLIGFILAIIYFYLWLVVYCYYLYLKEQDHRLPYYRPANLR